MNFTCVNLLVPFVNLKLSYLFLKTKEDEGIVSPNSEGEDLLKTTLGFNWSCAGKTRLCDAKKNISMLNFPFRIQSFPVPQ